jgi:hypothetical protein
MLTMLPSIPFTCANEIPAKFTSMMFNYRVGENTKQVIWTLFSFVTPNAYIEMQTASDCRRDIDNRPPSIAEQLSQT